MLYGHLGHKYHKLYSAIHHPRSKNCSQNYVQRYYTTFLKSMYAIFLTGVFQWTLSLLERSKWSTSNTQRSHNQSSSYCERVSVNCASVWLSPILYFSAYQYSNTTVMPLTYNNWAVGTGTISHPVNLLVTPAVVVC